ncbi:hypothetical protein BDZ89DRAFT_692121 [Hymenopellis radicata]|nr:hypothetical protein BDZ89DRAFT_692121 [Hymenopellis radicata]
MARTALAARRSITCPQVAAAAASRSPFYTAYVAVYYCWVSFSWRTHGVSAGAVTRPTTQDPYTARWHHRNLQSICRLCKVETRHHRRGTACRHSMSLPGSTTRGLRRLPTTHRGIPLNSFMIPHHSLMRHHNKRICMIRSPGPIRLSRMWDIIIRLMHGSSKQMIIDLGRVCRRWRTFSHFTFHLSP